MRLKKKRAKDPEADMTPMIDIVFQLIAFFMVLVNFTKVEQDDRIILPMSILAKPAEGGEVKNALQLQVMNNGQVIVAGDVRRIGPDSATLLDREKRVLGPKAADATIIIRAHESVKTGLVQELIEQCQKRSFIKFRLRAKEHQD